MATLKGQDEYKQTAVRLPPELHRALRDAASREERTVNGQMIAILRAALLPQKSQETAQ